MHAQNIRLDVFVDVFHGVQQTPQHFIHRLDLKLCFPPGVVNKGLASHSLSLIQSPD